MLCQNKYLLKKSANVKIVEDLLNFLCSVVVCLFKFQVSAILKLHNCGLLHVISVIHILLCIGERVESVSRTFLTKIHVYLNIICVSLNFLVIAGKVCAVYKKKN